MEAFQEFLVNNYLWFLVITVILIFALIGYLVDSKGKTKKEVEKPEKKVTEIPKEIEQVEPEVLNPIEFEVKIETLNNSVEPLDEDIIKEAPIQQQSTLDNPVIKNETPLEMTEEPLIIEDVDDLEEKK